MTTLVSVQILTLTRYNSCYEPAPHVAFEPGASTACCGRTIWHPAAVVSVELEGEQSPLGPRLTNAGLEEIVVRFPRLCQRCQNFLIYGKPERPRLGCLAHAQRNLELAILRTSGIALEDLAVLSGLSHERVRQIHVRAGLPLPVRQGKRGKQGSIDPIRVLRAVRTGRDLTSYLAVAERTGFSGQQIGRVIDALGFKAAVHRLFRARANAQTRRDFLAALSHLGQRLGYVPTQRQLLPDNGTPWWTQYRMVFGTIREAYRLLGWPSYPSGGGRGKKRIPLPAGELT